MQFESSITIARALEQIERRNYVLPAIQREFVWTDDQIAKLFDSMMRDYPIGAFLFWEVQPEHVTQYGFYDFVTNFDVRNPHNTPAKIPKGDSVIAVLDGQQRLTALNIALRGSYTEKLPRKRWDDPTAFPKKRLYLNLTDINHDAGAEQSKYRFEFLSDAASKAAQADGEPWFCVSDALGVDPASVKPFKIIQQLGLASDDDAYETLNRLVHIVNKDGMINPYIERSDDLDKVLNVFIRVNSGGTVLSYSDLLLSVATALWKGDARDEIYQLTDDLNAIGGGFAFSKDRVLKASLVLADLPDIKFRVDNFTAANVRIIEKQWSEVRAAMLTAARILARFGLTAESLTAENAIIPIAYFAKVRGLTPDDADKPALQEDRETIRSWVLRSLLRAGFWTGAVDSILLHSRDVLKHDKAKGFPAAKLEKKLATLGKSLSFNEEEIEDLLWTPYRSRNVFLLLTLLYPGVNVANVWHVDHVFPKSMFTRRNFSKLGLNPDDAEEWADWANRLPNLQLLEGQYNESKSDMLPGAWCETLPTSHQGHYRKYHDLDPLPEDLHGFPDWWDERLACMDERLSAILVD